MNQRQPMTSLFFDIKEPLTDRNIEFDILTPADRIPPFQIIRASNIHPLTDITVQAIYPATSAIVDLKALRDPATPMQLTTLNNGTDIIIWDHSESNPFIADITGGRFYIKVSDTVNTWYSRYIIRVSCTDSMTPPPSNDFEDYDLETEIPAM
jgi:hypothetical protein